jgi:MerR family transcriptional regulator, thiopeptide resistance regulator
MEWTVHQVAAKAGISSRTLRHYDAVGLLAPSRVGANGYRYYDVDAVSRLQRILLLRDLGLGLSEIAAMLDRPGDEDSALREHIMMLRSERDRLDQRIAAVQHILEARSAGRDPSLERMLDGFNDPYREGVIAQWGERAYEQSNAWWRAKSLQEQVGWKRGADTLAASWVAAWREGASPTSARAQELARRHVEWLGEVPGTPIADGDHARARDMVHCLGDMYIESPDFAATYGGKEGAAFVRDALQEYARRFMEQPGVWSPG